MDRGAWRAADHGAAKSWTRLKQLTARTHTPPLVKGFSPNPTPSLRSIDHQGLPENPPYLCPSHIPLAQYSIWLHTVLVVGGCLHSTALRMGRRWWKRHLCRHMIKWLTHHIAYGIVIMAETAVSHRTCWAENHHPGTIQTLQALRPSLHLKHQGEKGFEGGGGSRTTHHRDPSPAPVSPSHKGSKQWELPFWTASP